MERNQYFDNLKRINIVKGYLSVSKIDKNGIIELLNEFIIESDSKKAEIEKIKTEISNENYATAWNLLNTYKEDILKLIFRNPCSKLWDDLIQTGDSSTRYCMDCKKNVYLVTSEKELIIRKYLEQCVAINTYEFNLNKDIDKNFKACHIKFIGESEISYFWRE